MVDPEIIGSENLFGEELSFQFYELTSSSQLQSAWHTEGNKVRFIVIDELKIENARTHDDVDDGPIHSAAETDKDIPERENSQSKSLVGGDRDETRVIRSWSNLNCDIGKFLRCSRMFDHFSQRGC